MMFSKQARESGTAFAIRWMVAGEGNGRELYSSLIAYRCPIGVIGL